MNKSKNNPIYELTQTNITNEDGFQYEAYGIRAVNPINASVVDEIQDISTAYEFVMDLISIMTTLDVRIEHFRDIVFDSVYARYCVI